jgi:hypothetical protein
MIRSNGSLRLLGRTARATKEAAGMAFAGYLIRLRPDVTLIEPDYLQLVLATRSVRDQIERPARSSAGVHNLNLTEIRRIELTLPPRDRQAELVRLSGDFLGRVDALRKMIQVAVRGRAESLSAARRAVFDGTLAASAETVLALTGALPRQTFGVSRGGRHVDARLSLASPTPRAAVPGKAGAELIEILRAASEAVNADALFEAVVRTDEDPIRAAGRNRGSQRRPRVA